MLGTSVLLRLICLWRNSHGLHRTLFPTLWLSTCVTVNTQSHYENGSLCTHTGLQSMCLENMCPPVPSGHWLRTPTHQKLYLAGPTHEPAIHYQWQRWYELAERHRWLWHSAPYLQMRVLFRSPYVFVEPLGQGLESFAAKGPNIW